MFVGNLSGGGRWEKFAEMHFVKSNEAGNMEEILVWICMQICEDIQLMYGVVGCFAEL